MSKRRSRDEYVYGRHAVEALVARSPLTIKGIWMAEGLVSDWAQALSAAAQGLGIAVQRSSRSTLDKLADNGVHQGVVARFRAAREGEGPGVESILATAGDSLLLLLLDGVEDPHNLGACLRSAAAAGADAVLVPRSRGSALTPAARKAAVGAAELVPLIPVANLARCITDLSRAGVTVIGATAEASQSIYDVDLSGPCALVLGAEGSGLRALTRERCEQLVSIPMASDFASLNVSVATGICLFEAVRQRKTGQS